MNFPEDDVDIKSENLKVTCSNTQSSQVNEENDATPSLNNKNLTPNPQAVLPSDFKILSPHLEDKVNGKILTTKSDKINGRISGINLYLLDEVYNLKN